MERRARQQLRGVRRELAPHELTRGNVGQLRGCCCCVGR
jgi:hypothetical protein